MLAVVDISGQLEQSFGGGYSSELSTRCGSQKSHGLGVSVLRGMHVGRRESAAAKALRGVEKAPLTRREKCSSKGKNRGVNNFHLPLPQAAHSPTCSSSCKIIPEIYEISMEIGSDIGRARGGKRKKTGTLAVETL